MKHQVGISAEWYSFKKRPWPVQVCMRAEQALVPALSSQSRWKTGNQTQKHTSDISYKTMSDQGMSLKTHVFFLPLFPLCLSLSRSVDSQAFYHACPPTPQSLQTKTPAPHTPPTRTKGRTFHLSLPFPSIHLLSFFSSPSPCLIFALLITSCPLRLPQGYKENPSRLCPFPSISLADSGHMLSAAISDWSRGDVGRGLGLPLPLCVSKPFRVTQHTLCRQRPPVRPPTCWPAHCRAATGWQLHHRGGREWLCQHDRLSWFDSVKEYNPPDSTNGLCWSGESTLTASRWWARTVITFWDNFLNYLI